MITQRAMGDGDMATGNNEHVLIHVVPDSVSNMHMHMMLLHVHAAWATKYGTTTHSAMHTRTT